jgi:hypothetical protein
VTLITSASRQCRNYDNSKPLELFRKRANCKGCYGYTCLECTREYNRIKAREYYQINKDVKLQRHREYREDDKDKFNQYQREYKAKKRAENNAAKPLPDMEYRLWGEMRMVSELSSEELKELRRYDFMR